jgi:hypothetical protein
VSSSDGGRSDQIADEIGHVIALHNDALIISRIRLDNRDGISPSTVNVTGVDPITIRQSFEYRARYGHSLAKGS